MKFVDAIKRLFKVYFLAGLAVIIPLITTILILRYIIVFADDLFIELLPDRINPEYILGKDIPGLGFIITISVILLAGLLTRVYIGRKMVNLGEAIMSKIPLARTIYGGLKQFLGTILSRNSENFESVALVEYPRRGCWMVGFITGDVIPEISEVGEGRMVNVFIPTTPNPTSGFLIMVAETDVKRLSIGIDEAFKLIISGGILKNENEPEAI